MLDATELDVLYRDLPSYQLESVGGLTMAERTRLVLPPTLSIEPIASPLESAGKMTVASMMLQVLTIASLKVITNLVSLTLIAESSLSGVVTSPTSLVVGVLVSMKTPLGYQRFLIHLKQYFCHFFHCYDGEIDGGFIFEDYSLARSN